MQQDKRKFSLDSKKECAQKNNRFRKENNFRKNRFNQEEDTLREGYQRQLELFNNQNQFSNSINIEYNDELCKEIEEDNGNAPLIQKKREGDEDEQRKKMALYKRMNDNLEKCNHRLQELLPIIDAKIYKTKKEKELLEKIIDEEKEKERKRKEKKERKQQKKEQRAKREGAKRRRRRSKEQKEKEQREKEQREKEQREKEQREKEQREKEQREKEQREKEQREKELQESLEKMQGEGVFLNPVNQSRQRLQLIGQERFIKFFFVVLIFLIVIFRLIQLLRDKYYE